MTIRLSGLASGLDTESIVSALVSAYSYKKDKYVKAQTKLSWKQEAWSTLNSKIYSLYTSVGSMRYSSNYAMKKSTVSDSTKATITASGSAINGTQSLEIKQLAKAGYLTSAKLEEGTTEDTTLVDLGYSMQGTTGKIQVKAGDTSTTISVTKTSTISDVVDQLNDAGVTASYDETNRRIFVSSSASGASNNFSLTAMNGAGLEALSSLGLLSDTDLTSYGTAGYTSTKDSSGNITAVTGAFATVSAATTDEETGAITSIKYDVAATYNNVKTAVTAIRNAYMTLANEDASDTDKEAANATISNSENKKWINFIGLSEDEWLSDTLNDEITTTMSKVDSAVKLQASRDGITIDSSGTYKVYEKDDDGNDTTTVAIDFEAIAALGSYKTSTTGTTYYDSETTSSNVTTIMKKIYADYQAIAADDDTSGAVTSATEELDSINEALANANSDDETTAAAGKSALQTIFGLDSTVDVAGILNYMDSNYGLSTTDTTASNIWATMTSTTYDTKLNSVLSDIDNAASITLNNLDIDISDDNLGNKVDGQDATIELNGVEFTSSSNTITVNGLTIQALGTTTDALSITTSTDTSGLYDKVKEFLSSYNSLINEMCELYNADSASDYEPLTDDEKSEMSDTEIEKWEQKIKDSLLRRDTTLGSILTGMTTAMMQQYTVNGSKVSWSTYGIATLGYLNAEENENYAYHIDGDSEDSVTSGNEDKLTAALASDPDSVIDFLKQVTSGLYDSLNTRMTSNAVSSVYTVYNDKEMASEYSDYTTLIKTWTTRISDMEDAYYSKFAAMESALATLQSNSSSISSLLG